MGNGRSRTRNQQVIAPGKDSAVDHNTNWFEAIPGIIGKLIRRYGWLCGVYTALAGLGFVVIGALARIFTRSIFSSDLFGKNFGFDVFGNPGFNFSTEWVDEAGNVISSPFEAQASSFATNNPVAIMGTVIMVIGVLVILAGVIFAVYMKKRSNANLREYTP